VFSRLRYGPHPSQWADLTVPDIADDRAGSGWPVVIFLHGGYWRDRHGADQGEPLIADLVAHGVAALNVEYRRVGADADHGGGGWPATFADVAAAVDALADRGLHRRGIDIATDRVVAVGHSAGGQLAAWLAARPRLPAGAPGTDPRVAISGYVSLGGVLDLARAAEERLDEGAVLELLGGSVQTAPEAYAWASPLERLPLGVPGVCLHSTDDERVPYAQSERFVSRAVRLGDDCQLISHQGSHFDDLDPASDVWQQGRDAALAMIGQGDAGAIRSPSALPGRTAVGVGSSDA
jgi:acetyl esterase/lipase